MSIIRELDAGRCRVKELSVFKCTKNWVHWVGFQHWFTVTDYEYGHFA